MLSPVHHMRHCTRCSSPVVKTKIYSCQSNTFGKAHLISEPTLSAGCNQSRQPWSGLEHVLSRSPVLNPSQESSGCPAAPLSLSLPAISQGGAEDCWPSRPLSLIPADTAAAPTPRRSGNLSREKAVGEAELMAAWQAAGWLRGPGARLKMAAVKRCDVEAHRAKARLPLASSRHSPSPPPPSAAVPRSV